MLGQEVKTLVNKEQNSGTYQVMWDGNDNFGSEASSGVYFYKIFAGEYSSTKKMMFIK